MPDNGARLRIGLPGVQRESPLPVRHPRRFHGAVATVDCGLASDPLIRALDNAICRGPRGVPMTQQPDKRMGVTAWLFGIASALLLYIFSIGPVAAAANRGWM